MEDILKVYKKPLNSKYPVVCMDEQPVQLIKETRTSLPPEVGRAERVDYEYERNGAAVIFMLTQPLGEWRRTSVRKTKTKNDWALEIRHLLEKDFPDAEKIVLVMDNLNTHTKGALYKVFSPEEASKMLDRLEFHYTPKHGSWLNIAEIELSVLTQQCLARRIPDMNSLNKETVAWNQVRNEMQKGVDWQFTTEDARIKLKRLYPQYLAC